MGRDCRGELRRIEGTTPGDVGGAGDLLRVGEERGGEGSREERGVGMRGG